MLDIQNLATEKLQEIIDNGTVDTIVTKQVTKVVQDVVNDIFSTWSPFQKEVKKILEDKMAVCLDNINIQTYTMMVCHVIEETLTGTLLEDSKEKVKKNVLDVLRPIEKTEWKLSEIVAKYRKSLYEHPIVVVQIDEPRYSSYWIKIGEKKESSYSSFSKPSQSYDLTLSIDEKTKKINNVWYEGNVIDPRKKRVYEHTIEGFLVQLWAAECVITIDEDDAMYEGERDEFYD